jgi:carboxymethylenebutenolidase
MAMGERVSFPSNGHTCDGYFAAPSADRGPALVVIQEWWGLVPHIEDVVERFAAAGFVSLAPDLYHGKTTKSPDEAGRMAMEIDADRAEREISGAGDYLLSRPECSSAKFGVVGFCMGGGLAQYTATRNRKVGAAVSFYGVFKKVDIDWKNLAADLLLFYGENDKGVPPENGKELTSRLKALGKNVEMHVYPDAGHAFFNDSRPQVYNKAAAEDAWRRTIDFLSKHLG